MERKKDQAKTTRDALRQLPSGHCFVLSAPVIEHRMCGVADARISDSGEIKLVYTDGTEERATASDEILSTNLDDHSLIRWVAHVQGNRRM